MGSLALFALAFQFVVSFGHVHALGEGAPARVVAALGQSVGPADANHSKNQPLAHDVCAICAVMALAASALVPPAQNLAVLRIQARVRYLAASSAVSRTAAHAAFRARAPPA